MAVRALKCANIDGILVNSYEFAICASLYYVSSFMPLTKVSSENMMRLRVRTTGRVLPNDSKFNAVYDATAFMPIPIRSCSSSGAEKSVGCSQWLLEPY